MRIGKAIMNGRTREKGEMNIERFTFLLSFVEI